MNLLVKYRVGTLCTAGLKGPRSQDNFEKLCNLGNADYIKWSYFCAIEGLKSARTITSNSALSSQAEALSVDSLFILRYNSHFGVVVDCSCVLK